MFWSSGSTTMYARPDRIQNEENNLFFPRCAFRQRSVAGLCFFVVTPPTQIDPAVILSYPHLDSTNRLARELVLEGCAIGTVVLAESQSSGRGQYGRVQLPAGGLYFTLILAPDLPMSSLPLVTLATGLASPRDPPVTA